MRDQADQLRQLVRKTLKEYPALEPGVPLVVLSGGKSGVGTTSVAIQLVQQLAQLGKRAVLVDANLLQPAIASQLALETRGSLSEVLDGSRSAVEVAETVNESVCLLAGRSVSGVAPTISHESVSRLVTELRSFHTQADIAIIDAGSGMSPWTAELWRAAHQVLLVTIPEPVAVTDSYATVKHSPYAELSSKLRLVVNRCDDNDIAMQLGNRFATTCQQFLDFEVGETIAIASNDEVDPAGQMLSDSNRRSNAFKQSVRLLAAELFSSCLVLSKPSQPNRRDISEKVFKSTNKTQSVLLR